MGTYAQPHQSYDHLRRALDETNARDIAEDYLGAPAVLTAKYDQYRVRLDDDTPSFTVYRDGFKDYGRSGDAGGILALIELLGRMTRQEAIDYLLRRWHGECLTPTTSRPARDNDPSPRLDDAEHLRGYVEAARRRLQGPGGQRARDYLLKSRLLTEDTIARYGFTRFGTTVKTDRGDVWMPAGIVIPRFDADGKLIAVHTRRVVGELAEALGQPEELDRKTGAPVAKYMTRGTPSADVYGTAALTNPALTWVVLVEGEFDRDHLQARMEALEAPVAVVTKGSASGRLSKRTLDAIRKTGAPVAVLLDTDDAGQQGAADLIAELLRAGLPHAKLSNLWEQKDVTDAARAGVDVAGTVLAVLSSAIVQTGKASTNRTARDCYTGIVSEGGRQEHAADDCAICKHMTSGFRQFLMAGWQKRENAPLLIELLIEKPGQTASDLARQTRISRANVSHTLNELAAEGLVKKELCLALPPYQDKGDDLKHKSRRGRRAVVFSARVPTTDAECAAWVAYVERRFRKNAAAHVGQDERSALELIDEAELEVPEANAVAAARARIEPEEHDQRAEYEIRRRVSLLRLALKNTSPAAVIPTSDREAYTTACMKEHFDAVPLARKEVHARALGVSEDNFNACIRRFGFKSNATNVEETFRAGDMRQKLPALRKRHHARVIACRGKFGEPLYMPTDEELERKFDPNDQITVYLRGVNTYAYTGERHGPRKPTRTAVPGELADEDELDNALIATRTESPAERRFRTQYAPYVRVVDDESGELVKAPKDTPLTLIAGAWADGTLRIASSVLRAMITDLTPTPFGSAFEWAWQKPGEQSYFERAHPEQMARRRADRQARIEAAHYTPEY